MNLLNRDFRQMKIAGQHTPFWGGQDGRFLQSVNSFKNFLNQLSNFKEQQIILFASFENSDESFAEVTEGLTYSINKINDLLIRPITTNDN